MGTPFENAHDFCKALESGKYKLVIEAFTTDCLSREIAIVRDSGKRLLFFPSRGYCQIHYNPRIKLRLVPNEE